MIKTEKEYKKVKEEIKKQAELLEEQKSKLQERGLPAEIIQISIGDLERQKHHNELDVIEYEKTVAGEFEINKCDLSEIGKHLIRLRIWKGISQTELAKRREVDLAAVSKDERFEYQGAGVSKIQQVLKALEVDVRLSIYEIEKELVAGKDEMAATRKVV